LARKNDAMDWSKAKPGLIQQIVREGECYLDGQLKLALSADQRGAILAGVFTAAATAVLALLIGLSISKDVAIVHRYPVFLGAGVAAGMGVPAVRVESAEALCTQLERALAEPGPNLIEMLI